MRLRLSGAACTCFIAFSSISEAATLEFVPPNDTSGQVYSTNSNDGYSLGRGIVFEVTSNTTIDSVGIYHDLTDVTLLYEVAKVLTVSGDVTAGQTVLTNGDGLVTTAGLEWIDYGFSDLLLVPGSYHIEFSHSGLGNQNFYYNNENVRFTQDTFTLIDGTNQGNTTNFLMPAIRVNTVSAIPIPAAIWLFGSGLLGLIGISRRKKA